MLATSFQNTTQGIRPKDSIISEPNAPLKKTKQVSSANFSSFPKELQETIYGGLKNKR